MNWKHGVQVMALSDGIGSARDFAKVDARLKERRELLESIDLAAINSQSDVRVYEDSSGNSWEYVVASKIVKIIRCTCSGCTTSLLIPDYIEELPVAVIGIDSCSNLIGDIEEIVCPDTIVSIEQAVFRGNSLLEKIVFPKCVENFDSHWFMGAGKLKHLILPGGLKVLKSNIFDMSELETLTIGASLEKIEPGTFTKSKLVSVEIDSDNPNFSTDGKAIYSKDHSCLVALAVPCDSYSVDNRCKLIDKKAFGSRLELRSVFASDNLERIEPFAFFGCGISEFECPDSLVSIGERSFFNCENLERISLGGSLQEIQGNAFSHTKISSLNIPGTIRKIDFPVAEGCTLTYSGADATFRIAENENGLHLDEFGVLYDKSCSEGPVLVKAIDENLRTYCVAPGTQKIANDAFANKTKLEKVSFPISLREVGEGAFKGCSGLTTVDFNDGLKIIGAEAFYESALKNVYIPGSLTEIGFCAFNTKGNRVISEPPSIVSLEVCPGSSAFIEHNGMLLKMKPNGKAALVFGRSDIAQAIIPDYVDEILPYALCGIEHIEEMRLTSNILRIGSRGLAVGGLVRRLIVDVLSEEGHVVETHEFRFPNTDRGEQQQLIVLGRMPVVDLEDIYLNYDAAIINASSFDQKSARGLSLYSQVKKAIRRVKNPVFMAEVNKSLYENLFSVKIKLICVSVAKRDDKESLNDLLELGYINAENIADVIESVSALKDASITDYLLEMKRVNFGRRASDFDL
jgi:hypothetical protein